MGIRASMGFGELRFSIRLSRPDIDNANSNAPKEIKIVCCWRVFVCVTRLS